MYSFHFARYNYCDCFMVQFSTIHSNNNRQPSTNIDSNNSIRPSLIAANSLTHRSSHNMMSSGGNPSTTSNAGGTAANPPSNPFLDSYRAWSERTPFITRITTILVLVVYILSFFFDLDNYLTNIPLRSVNYFEFYRILLSPLVGNSIIFLIIMLLSFPAIGTKMENSMGSGAFLFLMLTIDIAINLSFLSLCYILYFSGVSDALLWPCADFWTILFALISIDCFLVRPLVLLSSKTSFTSKHLSRIQKLQDVCCASPTTSLRSTCLSRSICSWLCSQRNSSSATRFLSPLDISLSRATLTHSSPHLI